MSSQEFCWFQNPSDLPHVASCTTAWTIFLGKRAFVASQALVVTLLPCAASPGDPAWAAPAKVQDGARLRSQVTPRPTRPLQKVAGQWP